MGSNKWKQLAMMAGSIAAAGLVTYYLFRDNTDDENVEEKKITDEVKIKEEEPNGRSTSSFTKEEVTNILKDIIVSQEGMKAIMNDLTHKFKNDPPNNFANCYECVKKVSTQDPLEKYGISMTEFDNLLEKFQNDPGVREQIGKIMGAPPPSSISSNASEITKQQVILIHEYMLEELQKIVTEFLAISKKENYDLKTTTIAAQAMVGANVERKFGFTSDDIESAVLIHHQSLSMDPDFARINVQMQATMAQLMGSQFPGSMGAMDYQ